MKLISTFTKWFDSKVGLVATLAAESILIIAIIIEVYAGGSNTMLMLIFCMYIIDSALRSITKIKMLNLK